MQRAISKKADGGTSLLINIIIGIACVMVILVMATPLLLRMFRTGPTPSVSNMFGMLVNKTNSLQPGQKTVATFYLTKDYVVAGFDEIGYSIYYDCGASDWLLNRNKAVAKPDVSACKNSACICICTRSNTRECEKPKECKSITGVKKILFEPPYRYLAGNPVTDYSDFRYFFIKTTCIPGSFTASTTFVLEKKTDGNLYISEYKN